MGRIQLFEIEDQSWCPRSLRDAITDCIQYGLNLLNFYGPIFPHLREALLSSESKKILDLGSGAGGPWPMLNRMFRRNGPLVHICLSDKYPNNAACMRLAAISKGTISLHLDSINTVEVPRELGGFRTLFSCYHHFSRAQARGILQNAVDSGQGIGIFEITSRHPLSFFLVLGMPIVALLLGPFIKPFRFSRIFWTYVIPAAPIVGLVDGIVSCLRTYSCKELQALVGSLSPNGYRWIVGTEKTVFSAPITYLLGVPDKFRVA